MFCPGQYLVPSLCTSRFVLMFIHSSSLLNRRTNDCFLRRCLTKNSNAEVVIHTYRPVCVELYKDYKDLGRFMLRYSGETIAAGVVTEVSKTANGACGDEEGIRRCKDENFILSAIISILPVSAALFVKLLVASRR